MKGIYVGEPLETYLEDVIREVRKCQEGRYHGSAEFTFNFKEGTIININVKLTRSFKHDR